MFDVTNVVGALFIARLLFRTSVLAEIDGK